MHSRKALLILTAVAAVLVVVVLVDSDRDVGSVVISQRIVPEIATIAARGGAVARITWQRPGQEPYALVRATGEEWSLITGQLDATGSGETTRICPLVDDDAVSEFLATMESLSYVRAFAAASVPAQFADDSASARLVLTIDLSTGTSMELALGAAILATDRVWLARRDRAADRRFYLIEGYAARAIDRRPIDLCERRIMRMASQDITGIEIHAGPDEAIVSGRPPAIHASAWIPGAGLLRMDPSAHAELVAALEAVILERLLPGESRVPDRVPADQLAALTMRVLGSGMPAFLAELGPCESDPPDPLLRRVDSSLGQGCVPVAVLDRIRSVVARGPELLARMLVTRPDITEIRVMRPGQELVRFLARGSTWAMQVAARPESQPDDEGHIQPAEPQPTEPGTVASWLAGLQNAASGTYLSLTALARPLETLPVRAVIEFREDRVDAGDVDRITFQVDPVRGLVARRDDERAVMPCRPDMAGFLAAGPEAFRRRQILALEPYALTEAILRRGQTVVAHLVRGEMLDEFVARVPSGQKAIPGAVTTLRSVAHLRALAFPDPSTADRLARLLEHPRLAIELVFDPGPLDDQPVRHVLELAVPDSKTCVARIDAARPVFLVDHALCQALLAPWTRP